jgi:rhamnogalacturonyl hydrolase YesR
MVDNRITGLVGETIRQLDNIMNITPGQAAKDVVKKAIGRSVRSKDPMFWPAGMLMLGLVTSFGILKEEDELYAKAQKSLDDHLKLWMSRYGGRLDFVDDALAGYGVIRLYERTHDQTHRKIIEQINRFVVEAPTDYAGSIIYNSGKGNTRIFADGIGQTTLFMAAYIRMKMIVQELLYDGQNDSEIHYYSESDYLNEIGKLYIQFINFYRYGRDKKSGLIYHGYSLIGRNDLDYDSKKTVAAKFAKEYTMEHECQRHGLLGWGRAYGWLLMGLVESAGLEKYLIKKGKTIAQRTDFSLIPWYVELCNIAMDYQREDGGWSWQIQAIDGHIDMSATGMIVYSLARGITEGIIEKDSEVYERVVKSLDKAVECMLAHTDGGVVGDALSSCDDFGVHYQSYGNFPWGQGAVLAAVAGAMSRDKI